MTAVVVTETFLQPPAGKPVTVKLSGTDWMATGLPIFIPFGGFYEVVTVRSATAAVIKNIGAAENLYAGSEVAAGLRCVPSGVPGPILEMRFTWNAGALDPATMGRGMGTDNADPRVASWLYIRGNSNGGGPNPVVLWRRFFASTNRVKGYLELFQPNSPGWMLYLVTEAKVIPSPQVQAFAVEMADVQTLPKHGEDVFLRYGIAGDRGEP